MKLTITKILKKIIVSFFMLYGYNILVPAKALIAINFITVMIVTIFEIPGLILLILIRLFIYH